MTTIQQARERVARLADKDGERVFAREVRAGCWDHRSDVIAAMRGERWKGESAMKIYRAKAFGGVEVFPEGGGRGYPLDPRLDLRNHSPTGFAWGYGGSGPAQLALAILADHFATEYAAKEYADRAALALYQEFKTHVIQPKNRKLNFLLTSAEVARFVAQHVNRLPGA